MSLYNRSNLTCVDNASIMDVEKNIGNAVVELAKNLQQEIEMLELIITHDAFKGQAASAMANHVQTWVIPILANGIEACLMLRGEAIRVENAYRKLDNKADALIDCNEVSCAISRLNQHYEDFQDKVRIPVNTVLISAGQLGCDVGSLSSSTSMMNLQRENYVESCRKVEETAKQYDADLTDYINVLRNQISCISRVVQSARRTMHGGVSSCNFTGFSYADLVVDVANIGEVDDREATVGIGVQTNDNPSDAGFALGGPLESQATSDPILDMPWNTPSAALPFDCGNMAPVDDRLLSMDVSTDFSYGTMLFRGPSVEDSAAERDESYYSSENYNADVRLTRIYNPTPEEMRKLWNTRFEEKPVIIINLSRTNEEKPNWFSSAVGGR